MKLRRLVARDLTRSTRRLAIPMLAVASSIAIVTVLSAFSLGIHRNVVAPLMPKLPLEILEVRPRTLSFGLLAFDAHGSGAGIQPSVIERMRRIDGVVDVAPIVGAAFPMRIEGGEGFLGHRVHADVFATGIAPAWVEDDVAPGYSFADTSTKIPVLASRRLLELYNTTVATAIDKPRLSEQAVIGLEFELVLGASHLAGGASGHPIERRIAKVVGLSDRATLVGITVADALVHAWNRRFGHPESPIIGAYVRVGDPRDAGRVAKHLESLGVDVDKTARLIGGTVAIAGVLLSLVGLAILAVATLAVAQAFFLLVGERKSEHAILRAMGARRRDLRRLILCEAAIIGAIGSGVGLATGLLAVHAIERMLLAHIGDLPLAPERLAEFSPLLAVSGVALGVGAALFGAMVPAIRAAHTEPMSILRA